ncbi:CoA transferase [Galbitalea sp. SE-J8]|uniref:CoA transferase n=1 Tax=Galbitalea sp. SE-J8 TaxID=3054952 RepID=UPI00259CA4E8|nr:CoA transferase [Galbitalea sp. SE-J8]MDM4762800.1 CoA transferase [Galbitalea sp. SE-J8]
MVTAPSRSLADKLWEQLAPGERAAPVAIEGAATLDSALAVSELAAASVAVAGRAAALVTGGAEVRVDSALASAWFGAAVRPHDPAAVPSPWDALAGDYRSADGWIRLHTNAPHHRAAAIAVLGVAPEADAVVAAVAAWRGEELESAVVAAGGCAAVMRTAGEWARHPQGAAVAAEPLVAWGEGRAGGGTTAIASARVLDLTRVIAGPVATRLLAGLGADVLRVDPPGWDEPALEPDMTLGKRCARLDARTAAGHDRLRALVAEADIVVHGYRADALARLGLGDLDAIRPGIVDVGLDAYGYTGPWATRRGFDSLVQMSSGIAEEGMRWFGRDRPTPLPVQALDHATGYLAAAAALVGLARRARTGRGSRARLSLARTAVALTDAGRGEPASPPESGALARLAPASVLHTPWGPASLLPSPVLVGGEPLRFERGPRPLGSDAPEW